MRDNHFLLRIDSYHDNDIRAKRLTYTTDVSLYHSDPRLEGNFISANDHFASRTRCRSTIIAAKHAIDITIVRIYKLLT